MMTGGRRYTRRLRWQSPTIRRRTVRGSYSHLQALANLAAVYTIAAAMLRHI